MDRPSVLSCFAGMMRMTQRLHVAAVPEQRGIPTMRLDVIDVGGPRADPIVFALNTTRRRPQHLGAQRAPAWRVIPRADRRVGPLVLVRLTVFTAPPMRRHPSTAWHRAGPNGRLHRAARRARAWSPQRPHAHTHLGSSRLTSRA